MAIKVLEENSAFVLDDSTGQEIVKPARMANISLGTYSHPLNQQVTRGKVTHNYPIGAVIREDADGVVVWPAYGSGYDDMLSRALAGGYFGLGATPIADSYLSAAVSKIQAMVRTWVIRVRGRKTPVKKTLDLIAMADDSQFGASDFVGNVMGALSVDNRGAIGCQVPIGAVEFDAWPDYGMEAVPLPNQRAEPGKERFFVLRMESDAYAANRGLWTLDGLDCFPTGDPNYPFWYCFDKENDRWCLIHRDYGWQVLAQIGPKDNLYPGLGQSGAWRYSPYLAMGFAINRMEWEALIAQPPRGIVWASGLDSPTQFRDQIYSYQEGREDDGIIWYPGVFFGGSVSDKAKITVMPWVEPPAGYTPEKWERSKIDALAAGFHISSTQLQVRLGEGALTQSDVSSAMEAETAVAFWRHACEMIWNHLAPHRVTVTVIWPTDRTRRGQIDSGRELGLMLRHTQSAFPEEQLFEPETVRKLISDFIGIPLPAADESQISVDDRSDSSDIPASYLSLSRNERNALTTLASVAMLGVHNEAGIDQIVIDRESGLFGRIIERGPESGWSWIVREDNHTFLLPPGRMIPIPSEKENIDPANTFGFLPEDNEVLPPPVEDDLDLDWELAWIASMGILDDYVPEVENGTWEWDDERKVFVDVETGDDVSEAEMRRVRNDIADEMAKRYAQWPADNVESPAEAGNDSKLVAALLLGLISLTTFELLMRRGIQDTYGAQYLLGVGLPDTFATLDQERLKAMLLAQWKFLNGFTGAISTGELTEAQIAHQASLYFNSSVQAFENGHAAANNYDFLLPAMPGDGSSECLMNCRCYWLIADTGDFLEAYWIRTAAESCPTCIDRSGCRPVQMDVATGEHFNTECY